MESRNVDVSAQTNSRSPGPSGSSPRTDGEASSCRIPSHVFARNNSNDPGQWSFVSNDSLFSIHNTSFNVKDDWMSKSGEFGYLGDCITINSPLIEIPTGKSTGSLNHEEEPELQLESKSESESESDTEAAAAKTTEEEESTKHNNVVKDSSLCRTTSQRSDASGQSFAFPILTGNSGKKGSVKTSAKSNPQTSKPCQSPPPLGMAVPKTAPESPKKEASKPATETQQHAWSRKWLSSCCSCCPYFCLRHKPG